MTLDAALTFALAFFLLVVTPGPAIATIVSRTLNSGILTGFALTLGFIIGDFIFLSVAILGLAKLAATMGPFFRIVKYLGAAYMIYMGYKAFTSEAKPFSLVPVREDSFLREVGSGLLLILGNPKPIVFYSALLPSFFDLNRFGPSDFAIVFGMIICIALCVNGAYTLLADKTRRLFASAKAIKRLNQTTGTVLVGAGLAVAMR